MVVCKFFLRGQCKFGDRCRNEHPRGGSADAGGSYHGYGGGSSSSYDQRGGGGFDNQGGYYGNRSAGNYNQQHQHQQQPNPYVYINKNSNAYSGSAYDNRGRGGGGDGTKTVTLKDSFGTSQNRFDALSGLSDQHDRNDDIKPQDIIDAIKHDVEEWEGCKIWPFSSYKPVKSQHCLPGFDDISPEEVRLVAYMSEKERKFEQHKQCFTSLVELHKRRRALLKAPTRDMETQLVNIFKGRGQIAGSLFGNTQPSLELLYNHSGVKSLGSSSFGSIATDFGKTATASSAPGFGNSTFGSSPSGSFGNQPSQGQSSAGTGLFGKPADSGSGLFGQPVSSATTGTGLFGKPAQPTSTGTGLFGKPADSGTGTGLFGKPADSGTGSSSGMFGSSGSNTSLFGKPVGASGSSQSDLFGKKQGGFGGDQFSVASGPGASSGSKASQYTPLDDLTPEEKEAFLADSFTLGKVPTRPPPLELCR